MSLQPLAFTGISQYSQDFQTILNRTVQIASLPISVMQNEQADLVTRKQLLTNLNGSLAALGDTISALGAIGANKALKATTTSSSKVAIVSTTGSTPATYTISEITGVAHSASATTGGYANSSSSSVSSASEIRIAFDGHDQTIPLAPGENNLASLRDKINALGWGLTASILTTGTGATPYYLSVTASTNGNKPITLEDNVAGAPVNLLATVDNGGNAEFKINGAAVSKTSNLINDVVAGVTFSIAGTTTGSETVTLTLASSRTTLSTALQELVAAYNDVVDQVDSQTGETAGLLSGDMMVREAQNSLRALTNYNGTGGSIQSLAALGVELGEDGKAEFNQDVFNALGDTQIQDAFTFFGSSTTGLGGVAAKFEALSDPITGLIRMQQDKYDARDRELDDRIADVSERISALQITTSQRLQMMDALLAQLDSQRNLVDASVQSLSLVMYGRKDE